MQDFGFPLQSSALRVVGFDVWVKDSSRWVVTLIRGLYKPHIGPLPLYEPCMSLIWGYPPGNYSRETVPDWVCTQGVLFLTQRDKHDSKAEGKVALKVVTPSTLNPKP